MNKKVRHVNCQGFGLVELVICVLIISLVIGAGILINAHYHKTNPAISNANQSYQSVISKFVTAMENGNTNIVASFETSRFKDWIESSTTSQKNTDGEHGAVVTNNFYVLAQHDGELGLFSRQSLMDPLISAGTYKNGVYSPPEGTTGRSETYESKVDEQGKVSYYAPMFTIDVVNVGGNWLVDNVGFYAAATG